MPWGRPSCMSRSLTNYTLYYLKKFHNIDDIFIDYFSHISMHVFANCFPYLWLLIRVDACLWRTSSVGFRFLSSCAAGFWDGDAVRAQEEGFIGFIRVSYEFKDKKGGHVWFWSIDGLLQALNFFYCILQDSLMDLRGYRSTVKEPYISFISFYRERDAK